MPWINPKVACVSIVFYAVLGAESAARAQTITRPPDPPPADQPSWIAERRACPGVRRAASARRCSRPPWSTWLTSSRTSFAARSRPVPRRRAGGRIQTATGEVGDVIGNFWSTARPSSSAEAAAAGFSRQAVAVERHSVPPHTPQRDDLHPFTVFNALPLFDAALTAVKLAGCRVAGEHPQMHWLAWSNRA